jgi:thiamine pyrophosphokinase
VVVVAGGDVPPRDALDRAWPGWAAGIRELVAADGGLGAVEGLGLAPTVVVGDLDSADPGRLAAAEARGVRVLRTTRDKDESDTELAVLEAVRLGASRLTVLGALGGPRVDHALANVWLLALDALAGVDAALLDDRVRITLLAAPGPDGGPVERALPGPTGAIVSLLPFGGDVAGVTTRDLRYPLRDEALVPGPARGLSNVRTGDAAAVTIRAGRLLILEAAAPAGGLSSEP